MSHDKKKKTDSPAYTTNDLRNSANYVILITLLKSLTTHGLRLFRMTPSNTYMANLKNRKRAHTPTRSPHAVPHLAVLTLSFVTLKHKSSAATPNHFSLMETQPKCMLSGKI